MTIELLFSIVLLAFFSYCFVYIGNAMPVSPATELGAEQWPQLLLGLLVILLAVNIYQIIKKERGAATEKLSVAMVASFFKSKLIISFTLIIIMALMIEYAGFLLTTFLFIIAYGLLLGERRPHILIISGLFITILLYVVFSKGLSIMLPRGYGVMRDIALFIETF